MMKLKLIVYSIFLFLLMSLYSCKFSKEKTDQANSDNSVSEQEWAIAVHGGAGTMSKDKMTPELDKEYRASLQAALNIGKKF